MNKNMKKYKLIKEYPGSPIIGTIAKFEKGKWYCHMIPKLQGSDDELHSLGCGEVKLYPEFWQEIVEKDYEILSLARLCSIKPKITDVSDYGDGYIEALLKCDNARIHSVKRIFDGEVFTVGDKITGKSKYNCTINNIELNPNCNQIMFNRLDEGIDLINAKRIKQPLFTTEDGVDIFEGDNLYSIDNMLNIKKHLLFNARYDDNTLLNNRIFFNSDYKHFSTKEKAQEYIIMNKPCLSLNDVAKVYVSAGFEITKSNKNMKYVKQQLQLRELIKTKLKKAL